MEFWIIRDGEKVGPFADYELRSRIEAGELGPEDPVWHDGLDGWKPLREIARFQGVFDRPAPVPVPPPLPSHVLPPVTKEKLPVGRRFWARWFDIQLYATLWWAGAWLTRQDLLVMAQSVWFLFYLLPWFLVEAALIHRFGTTPGKALLGIRVGNEDGSFLGVGQSLQRAMRVFLSGIGLGMALLCQLCMLMNFGIARKLGITLWDRAGGHRVVYQKLNEWRILIFTALFLGFLGVQGYIQLPVVLASDKIPQELKAFYEKAGILPATSK